MVEQSVITKLKSRFAAPLVDNYKRRIIFWQDPDGEFSTLVLESLSIGGTINKVENLADALQVCFDVGAKKVLLSMSSAGDIATVSSDLFAKFQISSYNEPQDAEIKALGIE